MMVRSGAPVLYPRMTFQISDVSGLWFYLDLAKYKCLWFRWLFMIVYDCLCISTKKSNSDGFKEFACRLWSPDVSRVPRNSRKFSNDLIDITMVKPPILWLVKSHCLLLYFNLLPSFFCFNHFNHHLWLTRSLWSQCSAAQKHHFSICL